MRVLAWISMVAAAVWGAFVLTFCSDAGIPLPAFLAFAYGGMVVMALWVVRVLVRVVWCRRRLVRVGWRALAIEPLVVAILGTLVWTETAFKARFLLSQPFLGAYVRNIMSRPVDGASPDRPRIVGLFVVREVDVQANGSVRFITTRCMFDDCGLAYSAHGAPPVVGEDSYTRLWGGWWQWWRSW